MAVGLKICGVTTPKDALMCVEAGVDAIGINFWPKSKRAVSVAQGKAIADTVRGKIACVGVFVDADAGQVDAIARAVGLDGIQPHGTHPVEPYAASGWPWVWVVRTGTVTAAVTPRPAPRWILLDAPTAGYGGQGVLADWSWAADAVARLQPASVWLAGGLRPDNAQAAIDHVAPAGLDVASGAELAGGADGAKDAQAVAALAQVCNAARPEAGPVDLGYND